MRRTEPVSPLLEEPLDESPAIVWLKDLDGRYLRVNRRYVEQLGTDAESVCGHTDAELTAAGSIEGLRLEDKDIAASEPLELEYRIGAFEERPAFAALRFALRDGDGQPTATCSVAAPLAEAALARSECDRLMRLDRWGRLDAFAIRQELLDEWGLTLSRRSSGPPLDRDERVAAALAERDDALAAAARLEEELAQEREQLEGLRAESEDAAPARRGARWRRSGRAGASGELSSRSSAQRPVRASWKPSWRPSERSSRSTSRARIVLRRLWLSAMRRVRRWRGWSRSCRGSVSSEVVCAMSPSGLARGWRSSIGLLRRSRRVPLSLSSLVFARRLVWVSLRLSWWTSERGSRSTSRVRIVLRRLWLSGTRRVRRWRRWSRSCRGSASSEAVCARSPSALAHAWRSSIGVVAAEQARAAELEQSRVRAEARVAVSLRSSWWTSERDLRSTSRVRIVLRRWWLSAMRRVRRWRGWSRSCRGSASSEAVCVMSPSGLAHAWRSSMVLLRRSRRVPLSLSSLVFARRLVWVSLRLSWWASERGSRSTSRVRIVLRRLWLSAMRRVRRWRRWSRSCRGSASSEAVCAMSLSGLVRGWRSSIGLLRRSRRVPLSLSSLVFARRLVWVSLRLSWWTSERGSGAPAGCGSCCGGCG